MIKMICIFLFFSIISVSSFSQYTLQTPDGKSVKLNKNGTWEYVTAAKKDKAVPGVPKTSTSKYVSKHKRYELWYDPSLWYYDTVKAGNVFSWDISFSSTDFEITGSFFESRLSLQDDLEAYTKDQYSSMGELKAFKFYSDTINAIPVSVYEAEIISENIRYEYRGVIHSTAKGSFQFSVGTQKEVFQEDKEKILALLNGIVKIK